MMQGSINTFRRCARTLEILKSMDTARRGREGNMNLQAVSDQHSEAYCEETELVLVKCVWIKSVL